MQFKHSEEQRAKWREQSRRKTIRKANGVPPRTCKRYSTEEERIAASKAAQKRYRSKPEVKAKKLEREREYFKKNKSRIYANRQRGIDTNPCLRIKRNLRSRLRDAVRANARGGSAVRDLGCSVEFFRDFISQRFQPGMSWDNWGEWHLDHITPLAAFDLTDRHQFLSACHFTNMQPLWKADNLSKSDSILHK